MGFIVIYNGLLNSFSNFSCVLIGACWFYTICLLDIIWSLSFLYIYLLCNISYLHICSISMLAINYISVIYEFSSMLGRRSCHIHSLLGSSFFYRPSIIHKSKFKAQNDKRSNVQRSARHTTWYMAIWVLKSTSLIKCSKKEKFRFIGLWKLYVGFAIIFDLL